MPQATDAALFRRLFDRERLRLIADGLAIALATALPWSTSATAILSALWFVAVLPTLDYARLRAVLLSPAGGLPVVFALLALCGMLWSSAPLNERFAAVVPYARMLAIPLLICQFSRSERGVLALYGLIASSSVLLIASYWSYAANDSNWFPFPSKQRGVPIRDYIVQAGFFTICAFAVIELAIEHWSKHRRRAIALLALGAAFLANIVMVATSRTAVLVILALAVVLVLRRSTWKARAATLLAGVLLCGLAWASSDYLRGRVSGVLVEIRNYETRNENTSAGQRLEMWRQSIKLIVKAPVIGYGTGSLAATFKAATQTPGSVIQNADNPHNQTLTVAIQLGLLGVAVLYAMWLAHLLLCRGPGWVSWFGLVVVLHSMVGSLANSYLFDFAAGWTYAVGVGIVGGMVLRQRDGAAAPA